MKRFLSLFVCLFSMLFFLERTHAQCQFSTISTQSSQQQITVCVGDGQKDPARLINSLNSTTNYAYALTTSDFKILQVFTDANIDLESLPTEGVWIWGFDYRGTITAVVGESVFSSAFATQCRHISNTAVTIVRTTADAGSIQTAQGSEDYFACQGDPFNDVIGFQNQKASIAPYVYILTDESNKILDIIRQGYYDFTNYPAGRYRVWGLSYTGQLGNTIGANVDTAVLSNGCYDLSDNFVKISIGSISSSQIAIVGLNSQYFALNDNSNASVSFSNTATGTAKYAYLVIDESQNIVQVVNDRALNMSFLQPGKYFVWGISYLGELNAPVGKNLWSGGLATGCYTVSSNAVTVQKTSPAESPECDMDKTPPVITCPANISSTTPDLCAIATWVAPTATDNCGTPTIISSSTLKSGDCFPVGTTTIGYSARDAQGNLANCSFNITVTRIVVDPCVTDNIPPNIICPANLTVNTTSPNATCATATWIRPIATDNCGIPNLTLLGNLNNGDCFPIGTTTLTYRATDSKGNVANCSFNITVVRQDPCANDVTLPIINQCPTNIDIKTTNNCVVPAWTVPTVTDNCGVPTLTIRSSPQVGLVNGSCFPIGITTMTYTATDTKGNTSTCAFTITVIKEEEGITDCTKAKAASISMSNNVLFWNDCDFSKKKTIDISFNVANDAVIPQGYRQVFLLAHASSESDWVSNLQNAISIDAQSFQNVIRLDTLTFSFVFNNLNRIISFVAQVDDPTKPNYVPLSKFKYLYDLKKYLTDSVTCSNLNITAPTFKILCPDVCSFSTKSVVSTTKLYQLNNNNEVTVTGDFRFEFKANTGVLEKYLLVEYFPPFYTNSSVISISDNPSFTIKKEGAFSIIALTLDTPYLDKPQYNGALNYWKAGGAPIDAGCGSSTAAYPFRVSLQGKCEAYANAKNNTTFYIHPNDTRFFGIVGNSRFGNAPPNYSQLNVVVDERTQTILSIGSGFINLIDFYQRRNISETRWYSLVAETTNTTSPNYIKVSDYVGQSFFSLISYIRSSGRCADLSTTYDRYIVSDRFICEATLAERKSNLTSLTLSDCPNNNKDYLYFLGESGSVSNASSISIQNFPNSNYFVVFRLNSANDSNDNGVIEKFTDGIGLTDINKGGIYNFCSVQTSQIVFDTTIAKQFTGKTIRELSNYINNSSNFSCVRFKFAQPITVLRDPNCANFCILDDVTTSVTIPSDLKVNALPIVIKPSNAVDLSVVPINFEVRYLLIKNSDKIQAISETNSFIIADTGQYAIGILIAEMFDAANANYINPNSIVAGTTTISGFKALNAPKCFSIIQSNNVAISVETNILPSDNCDLTQTKIVASLRESQHNFGSTVAISGDYALVGSPFDYRDTRDSIPTTGRISDAGSASIFKRQTDGTWKRVQKIVASDRTFSDFFGKSVAIDGDFAAIGAEGDGEDAFGKLNYGSAYIYQRQADDTWKEIQKIKASDQRRSDNFGNSITMSNDIIVVGAPRNLNVGAAYVFKKQSSGLWAEQQKIVSNTIIGTFNRFGANINTDGTSLFVGMPTGAGTFGQPATCFSYVFKRQPNDTWSFVQTIVASDSQLSDAFGQGVSVKGDYAIIGAPNYKDVTNNLSNAGQAYIFQVQADGKWKEIQKIVPFDPSVSKRFGSSVALNNNRAIVGAETNNGINSGSAYIFQKQSNEEWKQTSKLKPASLVQSDYFGNNVAIGNKYAIVGALNESEGSSLQRAGSAYMFTLKDLNCSPINLVNPNNGQYALSKKTNDFTVQTIPNPVSNKLDILLSSNNEQPVEYLLYDAFGKVIYRQTKVSSDQFSIDMSNFANGLYILSTRQGDVTVQKKIVKVSAR